LRSALWVLSKSLLAPIDQGDGKRDPDKKAVADLAGSFPSERQYWALLEVPFHELFLALPGDSDAAKRRWCAVLQRTARSALALATDALDGSARSLKAAVAARSALERALHDKQVLPQYTMEEVTADAE
jgi:CTP:molybdopterin cytidylyltransferase MocA